VVGITHYILVIIATTVKQLSSSFNENSNVTLSAFIADD